MKLAVAVRTQPVLVNFSHVVVQYIQNFVKSVAKGNERILEQLTQVTDLGLEEMQKRVLQFCESCTYPFKMEAELKYALKDEAQLHMDLDLQTLTVVVPADATKPNCPALVIDSGTCPSFSEIS